MVDDRFAAAGNHPLPTTSYGTLFPDNHSWSGYVVVVAEHTRDEWVSITHVLSCMLHHLHNKTVRIRKRSSFSPLGESLAGEGELTWLLLLELQTKTRTPWIVSVHRCVWNRVQFQFVQQFERRESLDGPFLQLQLLGVHLSCWAEGVVCVKECIVRFIQVDWRCGWCEVVQRVPWSTVVFGGTKEYCFVMQFRVVSFF